MSQFFWVFALLVGMLGLVGNADQVAPPPKTGTAAPGSVAVASASTLSTGTTLADLLAFVPDNEANRRYLTFGDADGWHRATDLPRFDNLEAVYELDEAERKAWLFGLPSQTVPPESLGMRYVTTDDLRQRVGFDFFQADQYLEAGILPDALNVIVVDVPPAQIADALLSSGYTASTLPGATLYAIRDDHEIDLQAPTHTQMMAFLNRIAVLDAPDDSAQSTLLISRATAPIEDAANAKVHPAEALIGDPYYAALTEALIADARPADAELVGSIFSTETPLVDPTTFIGSAAEGTDPAVLLEEMLKPFNETPLNFWLVSALATYRSEDDLYLTVALALPPGVDGEANAASLASRLAEYQSVTSDRDSAEQWDLEGSGSVEIDDVTVAWATVRPHHEFIDTMSWMPFLARRDTLFMLPTE